MVDPITADELERFRDRSAAPDDEFEKHEEVDEDVLLEVLGEAVEAIEDLDLPYAFVGGLAAILLGPPSSTNDIDFFVRPKDAPALMEELGRRGFATKVHDPAWLLKAAKRGVLVDIIFRSTGDIYLDDEMITRTTVGEFKRQRLRIVSPEDLFVMKALAHGQARAAARAERARVRPGRGPARPRRAGSKAVGVHLWMRTQRRRGKTCRAGGVGHRRPSCPTTRCSGCGRRWPTTTGWASSSSR